MDAVDDRRALEKLQLDILGSVNALEILPLWLPFTSGYLGLCGKGTHGSTEVLPEGQQKCNLKVSSYIQVASRAGKDCKFVPLMFASLGSGSQIPL